MASFVNPQQPFKILYSFFPVNQLGHSFGIYAIQINRFGNFTYRYQKLSPMNIESYTSDAQIIKHTKLLDSITLRSLYKQFNKDKKRSYSDFADENTYVFIRNFIDKKIKEVLSELPSEYPLFLVGKDGYPAHLSLERVPEKAEWVYLVKKNEKGIFFSGRVNIQGKFHKLYDRYNKNFSSKIITHSREPWLVVGNKLVQINMENAKKVKPFLNKEFIFYDLSKEKLFCEKFLIKVLPDYTVILNGFNKKEEKPSPEFILNVQLLTPGKLTLLPQVKYNDKIFYLNSSKTSITEYDSENSLFYVIHRDLQAEEPFRKFYEKHFHNHRERLYESISLTAFIEFYEKNKEKLKELNIRLQINKYNNKEIILRKPSVEIAETSTNEGIELMGALLYDTPTEKIRIPFDKIKKEITGILEYKDKMLLIPENIRFYLEWLLGVADISEQKIILKKSHEIILRNLKENKDETLSEDALALPNGLQATLRPYQIAGVKWLIYSYKKGYGGILADEMGLGKTLQTIALLLKIKEEKNLLNALIVVPNALMANWKKEIQKFAPSLSVLIYHGVSRKKNLTIPIGEFDVWITTYGTLRSDYEELNKRLFGIVVLDESHYIKNKDAQVAKAAFQLKTSHRLALTGTPIENNLSELWSQMNFLNPGFFGSYGFFKNRFIEPIEKRNDAQRLEELTRAIGPLILRRTKEQVLKDLPPRLETVITCDMTEQQRRFYYENATFFRLKLQNLYEDPKARMQILAYLQRLRQIAIHPKMLKPEMEESGKLLVLMNLIEEILANRSKVLIFSHYVRFLTILRARLEKNKIPYAYIDGKVKNRQKQVDAFNKNENLQVFLISIKAGGVGLNLATADTVILTDPWWNPAIEDQAISRAHRIGQKNVLQVYKLITENSIEERILQMQNRKKELFKKVLKNELKVLSNLSLEELQELMSVPESVF